MLHLAILTASYIDFKNFVFLKDHLEVPRIPEISDSADLSFPENQLLWV